MLPEISLKIHSGFPQIFFNVIFKEISPWFLPWNFSRNFSMDSLRNSFRDFFGNIHLQYLREILLKFHMRFFYQSSKRVIHGSAGNTSRLAPAISFGNFLGILLRYFFWNSLKNPAILLRVRQRFSRHFAPGIPSNISPKILPSRVSLGCC